MKKVIYGLGGVILGGLLGSFAFLLLGPLIKALFALGLAAGGGYAAYQYAKRQEVEGHSDWRG